MYWHDALYYVIVTFSTVGYGDVLPVSCVVVASSSHRSSPARGGHSSLFCDPSKQSPHPGFRIRDRSS